MRDSRGLISDPVAVFLDVLPVADAFEGVADRDTTLEDTPLVVAAPGVLANDPNPDGAARTVRLVAGSVEGGVVDLQPGGGYTFTPEPDRSTFYVRQDGVRVPLGISPGAFAYEIVSADGVSDPVQVFVEIEDVNDAPVAVADTYAIDENQIADYDRIWSLKHSCRSTCQ